MQDHDQYTANELAAARKRLALGEQLGVITTLNHPTSGRTYAIVEQGGLILWAAGPLTYSDHPADVLAARFSGYMEDDADWLMHELERNTL